MKYSPEQVVEIQQGYKEVLQELETLTKSLVRDSPPSLSIKRAQEYLDHGVCRRFGTIQRCIQNIFSVFPPDRIELLNEQERSDVEINLHAFVLNLYGVTDNLAWVYLLEKGIALKPSRVGLFNRETQKYLPQEVRDYLRSKTIKEWHGKYAKDYRDALAHRVPLYVPPWTCTPAQGDRYRELEAMISAEISKHNFAQVEKLTNEQDALRAICLTFLHSFSDDHAFPPVYFHPQLIADARTAMEIVRVFQPHLRKNPDRQMGSQERIGRVSGFVCWFRKLIEKIRQWLCVSD